MTDGIDSSEATVTVDVLNVNDAPTSESFDLSPEDLEDGETSITVDFSDYISDLDEDDLNIRTIPPSSGDNLNSVLGSEFIATGTPYVYTYTPELDFDIMLYKVDDSLSESEVSVVVYDPASDGGLMRTAPLALDDEKVMQEDDVVTIEFSSYDTDYLFGAPTMTVTTQPENGTLGVLSEPTITSGVYAKWTASYTPNVDYNGSDSITFSVTDHLGNNSLFDGTVSITINPVNDAPVLSGVSDYDFDEDGTLFGTLYWEDVDNSDLSITVSDGVNITVQESNAFEGGNTFTFSALENWSGSETFTASVSDGELTDSQVFTVTVNPVNDAPVIIVDSTYSCLLYTSDAADE